MNKRIGINLLWLKPNKNGGLESYARNLLDGFSIYGKENKYLLITTKNNSKSFQKYFNNENFEEKIINIDSENVKQKMIWESIFLNSLTKQLELDILLNLHLSSPIFKNRKCKIVTVFHDLQFIHYPKYFSKMKLIWFKFALKKYYNVADKIIAISEFGKKDIIEKLKPLIDKVEVIYNPIILNTDDINEKEEKLEKFGLKKNSYYYTVSSLLPHKNLITLLKMIKIFKERNKDKKLVISGVGGKDKEKLEKYILENSLEDEIILTGFISNSERNVLYKFCDIFLFPSIFEGFGMPPIEAMMLGKNVITTKETSIYEVTRGKANYVENPFDAYEWIKLIKENENRMDKKILFDEYSLEVATNQYLRKLNEL